MKRSFTLVELLVVIAIIGILSSILLPTVGRARAQANATKCISNMKNVTGALINYSNDPAHKNRLPVEWAQYDSNNDGKADVNRTWMEELVYAGAMPEGGKADPAYKDRLVLNEVFYCPDDMDAQGFNTSSYAVNFYLTQPRSAVNKKTTLKDKTEAYVNLSTVESPGNLAILFENRKNLFQEGSNGKNYLSITLEDMNTSDKPEKPKDSLTRMCRHNSNNSTNIGYLDGHVAAMERGELYSVVNSGYKTTSTNTGDKKVAYKILNNMYGTTGGDTTVYNKTNRKEEARSSLK